MNSPQRKGRPLEQTGNRPETTGKRSKANTSTPPAANPDPASTLLPRLERVKETAPGQWIACCPAHDDRSPSLSIKQTDDRLLVHCFAGCPASDVTAAVGLSLADLFDKPLQHHRRPMRLRERKRHDQARAALLAIRHEARVIHCAAGWLANGETLTADDLARLVEAEAAIKTALEVAA